MAPLHDDAGNNVSEDSIQIFNIEVSISGRKIDVACA